MLVSGNQNKFEVLRYYTPRSPQDVSWWEKSHDIQIMIYNWTIDNTAGVLEFDLAIEEPFVPSFGRVGAFGLQNRFVGMLYTFMKYNFPGKLRKVLLVHPKTAKLSLTGKGNATKEQMIRSARRYTRLPVAAKSQETIADAIGIAHAVWEHQRQGIKGVQEFEA